MQELLPIGRFAQISDLSVRALRLYDEEGLLKPAFVVPESGYRYYAPAQLIEVDKIHYLRELGFSLEDVRRILAERDRETIKKSLADHERRLECRQRMLDRSLAFLRRILVDEEDVLFSYEVREKRVDPVRVACVRFSSSLERLEEEMPTNLEALRRWLRDEGIPVSGSAIALYPDCTVDFNRFTVEACFPVAAEPPPHDRFEARTLPGYDRVVFTLHVGPPFEALTEAYAAVKRGVAERGLLRGGPYYEIYLHYVDEQPEPREQRTELGVPAVGP